VATLCQGPAHEAIIDMVLPVFAIIAAGWLCGWLGLLGDDASRALNGFVYFAALPALFFGAMATVPLEDVWAKSLLVLTALPTGSLVFVLSSRYGVYTQRSTGVILASTLVSVTTLSLLFNLLGVR